jgi:hypothetical protein
MCTPTFLGHFLQPKYSQNHAKTEVGGSLCMYFAMGNSKPVSLKLQNQNSGYLSVFASQTHCQQMDFFVFVTLNVALGWGLHGCTMTYVARAIKRCVQKWRLHGLQGLRVHSCFALTHIIHLCPLFLCVLEKSVIGLVAPHARHFFVVVVAVAVAVAVGVFVGVVGRDVGGVSCKWGDNCGSCRACINKGYRES